MLNNPVLDTIAKRSSIRAYADTPLTCEQLEALKLAVLASPTAVNAQAQRHLFITNPQIPNVMSSAFNQISLTII